MVTVRDNCELGLKPTRRIDGGRVGVMGGACTGRGNRGDEPVQSECIASYQRSANEAFLQS